METIKNVFYCYLSAAVSLTVLGIFIGSDNAYRLLYFLLKINPAYWFPKGVFLLARKKLLHSRRENILFGILFVLALGCIGYWFYGPLYETTRSGMWFVYNKIHSLIDHKDLFTVGLSTVLSSIFILALIVSPLSFGKAMLEWFRPVLRH